MQKIKSKLNKKQQHQASNVQNNSQINHSSSSTSSSTTVPTAEHLAAPESAGVRVEPVVEPVGPYRESSQQENNIHNPNRSQGLSSSLPPQNLPLSQDNRMDFLPPISSNHSTEREPIIVQRVEKPIVVKEHVHPLEKEVIQPIIHREREQVEIRQVTQPTHEVFVAPTIVKEGQLKSEFREPIVERAPAPIPENVVLPSTVVAPLSVQRETLNPILKENIQKTIVEEITQVIEKQVFAPVIVEQTQPIYEKEANRPSYFQSTLPTRELQVIYGSNRTPMEGMRGNFYADYASRSLWEKDVTLGGTYAPHFERQVNVMQRANNFVALPTLYTRETTNAQVNPAPIIPQRVGMAPFLAHQNGMGHIGNQSSFVPYQNQHHGMKTFPVSHGIPMSVTAQPNGGFREQSYQTSGTAIAPFSAR